MVKFSYHTEDKEPTETNFKIVSEGEHLFQVVDTNGTVLPSSVDESIQLVRLEVVGGNDNGLSILNRVNLNGDDRAFYFTRLFLKAIGEPYKGQFFVNTENWIGRQFYAFVKHTKSKDGTKTYANISEYNFNKIVEKPKTITDPSEIQWKD